MMIPNTIVIYDSRVGDHDCGHDELEDDVAAILLVLLHLLRLPTLRHLGHHLQGLGVIWWALAG